MPSIKRFLLLLFLPTLFVPAYSFAANQNYFEFAPDAWESYRLAASMVETPYQLFQTPDNITLTGFDFWVDNTGSAGDLTFTILDDSNTTLGFKAVPLPHLPAVPGGNIFHVDLDTPIDLSKYITYAIQISNTLPGFGLYYANKITLLEHNQNYTTSYVNGSARLGSDEQNFTFKFALYRPEPVAGQTLPPSQTPTSTPTSTTPTSTIVSTNISNARVVSVTNTSAVLAWSTNVAADSRVSIRSQINPLYVVSSASDGTFELEHALTVTGLTPNAFYFADVFSSQGANEQTLTTYTIGFQTAAGPPPSTSTSTPPVNNPPPPASTSTPPNTSTSSQPQTQPNNPTSSTPNTPPQTPSGNNGNPSLPPPTIGSGERPGNTGVGWNAPGGVEPIDGYRIDIFDSNHILERQITVPSGTHVKDIAELNAGNHSVIIYADNGGVFTKVALPTQFETKEPVNPLVWFFVILGALFGSGIGYIAWRLSKERAVNANLEEAVLK